MINKQANLIDGQSLLKWLDVEIDLSSGNSEVEKADRWAFRQVKKAIQSGRFDTLNEADQLREEVKRLEIALYTHESYDKSVSELHQENERLRAALVAIKPYIDEDFPNGPDGESDATVGYRLAYKKIVEALSTTTEPTGAQWVREPVAWFAEQMEEKLRENDHKGGWQDCSLDWLVERLYAEAKELWVEIDRVEPEADQIVREATDVANFAMMIADNARRINAPEKEGGAE